MLAPNSWAGENGDIPVPGIQSCLTLVKAQALIHTSLLQIVWP